MKIFKIKVFSLNDERNPPPLLSDNMHWINSALCNGQTHNFFLYKNHSVLTRLSISGVILNINEGCITKHYTFWSNYSQRCQGNALSIMGYELDTNCFV